MTSKLLVKPTRKAPDGRVHNITPASAGWRYVGFEVFELKEGQSLEPPTEARELCLVLLCGRATVVVDGRDFGVLGERATPFDGRPWSVYVPPKAKVTLTARSNVELGVCAAPAEGRYPPRVIAPSDVPEEVRGTGTNMRYVRNILPETAAAERLLIAEVITPGGNWSSYPPHKHDSTQGGETQLEETYYHRMAQPAGFAFQRVYTDDRSLDESIAVEDGDVVLVPKGYHPVGAPHGIDLYYLNVMAGPERRWQFTNAPGYEFVTQRR
jgi:5-deoxy-glucuronate isomerase